MGDAQVPKRDQGLPADSICPLTVVWPPPARLYQRRTVLSRTLPCPRAAPRNRTISCTEAERERPGARGCSQYPRMISPASPSPALGRTATRDLIAGQQFRHSLPVAGDFIFDGGRSTLPSVASWRPAHPRSAHTTLRRRFGSVRKADSQGSAISESDGVVFSTEATALADAWAVLCTAVVVSGTGRSASLRQR